MLGYIINVNMLRYMYVSRYVQHYCVSIDFTFCYLFHPKISGNLKGAWKDVQIR